MLTAEFNPLLWTRILISVGLFVGAAELLIIRRAFSDEGVWRWSDIRAEFSAGPFRWFVGALLNYRSFVCLLGIQLVGALLLPFFFHPALVAALLFAVIATAVRFRGTFNGGSDFMTVVVLSGLFVAAVFSEHPTVVFGGVCYIAVVSVLSYFIAGIAKLRSRSWRRGEALPVLISGGVYGVSGVVGGLFARQPVFALLASWAIILFECAFPLALFDGRACLILLGLGVLFHLLNSLLLGLNRFLLVWVATYPAILWFY